MFVRTKSVTALYESVFFFYILFFFFLIDFFRWILTYHFPKTFVISSNKPWSWCKKLYSPLKVRVNNIQLPWIPSSYTSPIRLFFCFSTFYFFFLILFFRCSSPISFRRQRKCIDWRFWCPTKSSWGWPLAVWTGVVYYVVCFLLMVFFSAVKTAVRIHHELKAKLNIENSIGITSGTIKFSSSRSNVKIKKSSTGVDEWIGTTFCGTVGSTARREYAVVGDIVNLSARLMAAAKGRILCDRPTYRTNNTVSLSVCIHWSYLLCQS